MILTAVSSNFVPCSVIRDAGGGARPGLESRVVHISRDVSQAHCLGHQLEALARKPPKPCSFPPFIDELELVAYHFLLLLLE